MAAWWSLVSVSEVPSAGLSGWGSGGTRLPVFQWQVTLGDPIWQTTLCSSEMGCHRSYRQPLTFSYPPRGFSTWSTNWRCRRRRRCWRAVAAADGERREDDQWDARCMQSSTTSVTPHRAVAWSGTYSAAAAVSQSHDNKCRNRWNWIHRRSIAQRSLPAPAASTAHCALELVAR